MLCDSATISNSIFFIRISCETRQFYLKKYGWKISHIFYISEEFLLVLQLSYRFRKFRYHFKSVADNSIIGGFKKRSFWIFVYYNNRFASIHTGEMLYGSRNANGNLKIRGNGNSRLTYV